MTPLNMAKSYEVMYVP